jgi:nucleoside-diphosphate-sugar epimerase
MKVFVTGATGFIGYTTASRAGKTKPSHGDVVGMSDSGRYSAIARMMAISEVDPGGP